MTAIIDDFAAIQAALPPATAQGEMSCEELAAVEFEPQDMEAMAEFLPGGVWPKNLADGCEFAGMILSLPKSDLINLVKESLRDNRQGFKETLLAVKDTADFCREALPDLLMAALSRAMIAWSVIATREPSD